MNEEKMVEFLEMSTEHSHILACDKPKDST